MTDNHDPGFEFEKDLEIDVDVDLEFDVDVDVDVEIEKCVDIDIESDVDIDGNTAEITFDVQAIGDNTLVEAIVSVLTVDNELSSISGNFISATD